MEQFFLYLGCIEFRNVLRMVRTREASEARIASFPGQCDLRTSHRFRPRGSHDRVDMSERLPSVQPLAGAGSASTPSGGWRLTKWQLALAIGIPLAAASLAGTALLLYAWKRRREPAREAPEEISRSQSVSSEGGPATTDAQPTPAVTVKQQVGHGLCPRGGH